MVGVLVLLFNRAADYRSGERPDRFWRMDMADIVALKRGAPEEAVSGSVDRGILRITLANPPANALSFDVMTALQGELDRARERKIRARRRARRLGQDFLRRSRPQADERPPHRRRQGQGVFRGNLRDVLPPDAVDRKTSEAGHRRSRRHRHRGRLPACRLLRSCDRVGPGDFRRERHQCRTVLHHARRGAGARVFVPSMPWKCC